MKEVTCWGKTKRGETSSNADGPGRGMIKAQIQRPKGGDLQFYVESGISDFTRPTGRLITMKKASQRKWYRSKAA